MASTWMAVILIKDKWFPGFKQYAFGKVCTGKVPLIWSGEIKNPLKEKLIVNNIPKSYEEFI